MLSPSKGAVKFMKSAHNTVASQRWTCGPCWERLSGAARRWLVKNAGPSIRPATQQYFHGEERFSIKRQKLS